MKAKLHTVWITKYALTATGIIKADGCEISDGYAVRDAGHCTSPDYVFARVGKDAFTSEAEAKKNALERIDRRLKAVNKEKAKLETLRFKLRWGNS